VKKESALSNYTKDRALVPKPTNNNLMTHFFNPHTRLKAGGIPSGGNTVSYVLAEAFRGAGNSPPMPTARPDLRHKLYFAVDASVDALFSREMREIWTHLFSW
jgi:hypothetical protein